MIYFFLLAFVLVSIGLIAWFIKNFQLRRIQDVFRHYNEAQDLSILLDWIEEKNQAQRMVRVLDYLCKIEDEALAVRVFEQFGSERFTQRHIRIFACKAYAGQGMRDKALAMAALLLETYRGDDSILELCLDIYLRFDHLEPAREMLTARLNHKFKGTIFLRFYSQLLAAEGKLEEAVKVLADVVEKEKILYQNTFAPPQKKLIYDQYVTSHKLLDSYYERMQESD